MTEFRIPAVDQCCPFFYRPYCLLPLVTLLQSPAFDDTSARKTNKTRMQVGKQLNQVIA